MLINTNQYIWHAYQTSISNESQDDVHLNRSWKEKEIITSLSSAEVMMSKSLGVLFRIRSRTQPPTRYTSYPVVWQKGPFSATENKSFTLNNKMQRGRGSRFTQKTHQFNYWLFAFSFKIKATGLNLSILTLSLQGVTKAAFNKFNSILNDINSFKLDVWCFQ